MRNTGKTTRKLAQMLLELLKDKVNQQYVYVTPYGWREADRVMRMFSSMLSAIGIKHTVENGIITYDALWDGEFIFVRKIRFCTREDFLEKNLNRATTMLFMDG